jgi:hypothetical protein
MKFMMLLKTLRANLLSKNIQLNLLPRILLKHTYRNFIKRGIKPGLIVVDYADLLKPVVIRKEKRNDLSRFMKN